MPDDEKENPHAEYHTACDFELVACERDECNCPRYLHDAGTGACTGCGDCKRFVG